MSKTKSGIEKPAFREAFTALILDAPQLYPGQCKRRVMAMCKEHGITVTPDESELLRKIKYDIDHRWPCPSKDYPLACPSIEDIKEARKKGITDFSFCYILDYPLTLKDGSEVVYYMCDFSYTKNAVEPHFEALVQKSHEDNKEYGVALEAFFSRLKVHFHYEEASYRRRGLYRCMLGRDFHVKLGAIPFSAPATPPHSGLLFAIQCSILPTHADYKERFDAFVGDVLRAYREYERNV